MLHYFLIKVNLSIIAVNPFIESYITSDLFGKLIFLGLFFLSILSWIILIHKFLILRNARIKNLNFHKNFLEHIKTCREAPLAVDISFFTQKDSSPFLELYQLLKKQSFFLLSKNETDIETTSQKKTLRPCDFDAITDLLQMEVVMQSKKLEKNLYILSTVVTLAPFIGLLGTVWGILVTFAHLQTSLAAGSQGVLAGLSLALTTTVLGLVDAIPALIGYNYLKNTLCDLEVEMENFTLSMLTAVEREYSS